MKILFTGSTGVLGHTAVPRLVAAGHEVTGAVRPDTDAEWLRTVGVEPVSVDLFDAGAVREAAAGHDAIVHYATSIPSRADFAKRRAWVGNDRLRTDATKNLVDAALTAELAVFVQQSISFVYADGGDRWLDEDAEVAPVWDVLESALDAEREVARFTAGGGRGVALRMGRLYGPGSASAGYLDGVAARSIPIVGSGETFVSHLHSEDAGAATVAALESAPAGVYNVSDGNPVRAAHDLALVAELLGAAAPRRVPVAAARLALGQAARMLAISQRVAVDRFRTATGWHPVYSSVEDGWRQVIAERFATAS
jgi:nucleoside-diphosphate-sugar epimerase